MKNTSSQKIALSILGVAVCAFIWDRYFNGTPTLHPPAGGADSAATILTGVQTISNVQPALNGGEADTLFDQLERLQTTQEKGPIRDAFAVPSGFETEVDTDQRSKNERSARFDSSHHLKAVICSKDECYVVVDDSLIKVGQSLDGFTLESVGQTRAVFVAGDIQAELRLQQPDGMAH